MNLFLVIICVVVYQRFLIHTLFSAAVHDGAEPLTLEA